MRRLRHSSGLFLSILNDTAKICNALHESSAKPRSESQRNCKTRKMIRNGNPTMNYANAQKSLEHALNTNLSLVYFYKGPIDLQSSNVKCETFYMWV